jgi:gliding motility-associated-like protein
MKNYLLSCFLLLLAFDSKAQCWKDVSAGQKYTLALKNDGTLWSWGDNSSGQLGDGTYISRNIPVQVGTATNWQSISASDVDHAKAIQTNGTLWGWGNNIGGQQGDGTVNPVLVPTQIGTDTDWKMVDGTWFSTVALKTNGTLWAWGTNNVGQLGNGTLIQSLVPVQVGSDTDWKTISAGNRHLLAVKTNGTLWAWGENWLNQLGDGTNNNSLVPIQIGTGTDWQTANAGWLHSSAQKTNGTLWTWGSNANGAIGDGTTIDRSIPTLVTAVNNFQLVSLGTHFTIGVRTNGTLWAWGNSISGQLGYGNNATLYSPLQSGIVTNWKMVDGGYDHIAGIRTDGSLWTCGSNIEGQMGTGNYWSNPGGSNIPMEVLSPNVITASATATTVCVGSSVVLTATGTATSYTWSGGVINGASFVPTSTAVYSVTGYDASGCYNTSTVQISVNPITTVTANATSTTICAGGTVALTGSGAANYTWSGTVVNGLGFSPVGTTTYTVTDTTGCSNTASITVNVIPLPTVSVSSTSVCYGSNAVLTASATPVSGTTYSWSTGIVGNSLSVSPISNAVYTVTATNSGCDASAIASVSVVPVVTPVTGFSYASPLCLTATNPLPMPISGFSASGTYFSGAGLTINSTTGLIDLSSSNAGTYVITYSVAANGCNPSSNSTFTLTLDAPTVPITNFSYTSPFCQKDANPSPLLASNFVSGGTFNSIGLNVNATNGTINLASSTAGTYTVSYQVNAANCVQAGISTTTVVVNSNPTLGTSSSTVISNGEQTILTASSSANTYTWFPTTNLSCTNCANPTALPNVTTNYCVQTTDGVCTNSACINVIVEALCEGDKGLYLPNAFSPNGDANNDVFCLQGEIKCVTTFKMLIFDRWGEKVFETADILVCWDGTFNGKKLNPDVYVYYITATNKDQEKITKKGNVTLIK